MKAEVTEQGVLIPKELLKGITQVEIRKRNNLILVIPLSGVDPIFQLGQNPVSDDLTDASANHESYICE